MPLPASAERERLQALEKLRIAGTPPSPEFDRLCSLARNVFGVPISLITLLDERHQWFKARCGLDAAVTAREVAFCNHTILEDDVLIVPDARRDGRFAQNPLVKGPPFIRFYAGAPLILKPGVRLGSICIIDDKPRQLKGSEAAILSQMAELVIAEIHRHRFGLDLAAEREGLDRAHLAREDELLREQLLRSSAELKAGLGSWEWERSSGAMLWSDGLRHLLGEQAGEVLPTKERLMSHVHPEDARSVEEAWDAIARGEAVSFEMRLMPRSGHLRWLSCTAQPLGSVADGRGRMLGMVRDVTQAKEAESKLRASEERYRALTNATASIVWHASSDGFITEGWGWDSFTGQPEQEGIASGWAERVHPDDRQETLASWQACVASGVYYDTEFRIQHVSGSFRWVRAQAVPIRNSDGSVREWIGMTSEIEEQREARLALIASEERLRLALETGRMFAWEVDGVSRKVSRSSNAAEVIGPHGDSAAEFLQQVDLQDRQRVVQTFLETFKGGTRSVEFRYLRPDGKTVWLGASGRAVQRPGESSRVIGICSDISERKAAENHLWRAANYDVLTKLPNRLHFQERLDLALRKARDGGTGISILLLDLDDFKDVNDTLGHAAGDALLCSAAQLVQEASSSGAFVARLGGDEFAIIIESEGDILHAEAVAADVLAKLRQPRQQYEGRMLACRGSIGIACFPEHQGDAAELLKFADLALYRAKADGRNRWAVYSPDLQKATEQRVSLGGEISAGLVAAQFVPFYQPIICLSTGRVAGFEALARWRHPDRGLLSPGAFSLAFEEPELAREMGFQILDGIVADVRDWLDRGMNCGKVALNLSAADLQDPAFAEGTLERLAAAGISTADFKIEVTESVFLGRGAEHVESALRHLHDAGVEIALDDFGTGYASLTHLKQFPVDQIKIDQSFMRSIEAGSGDDAIVSAVIRLAEVLRMSVVAEGVETRSQLKLLQNRGCQFAQGYLFAKPMAASRVPHFLNDWWGRRAALVGGEFVSEGAFDPLMRIA